MTTPKNAALGLVLTALVMSGVGCELVAEVDRSQIPVPAGVGGFAVGGGGANVGGSDVGGGGSGGAPGCNVASDCPAPASECVVATCEDGTCGTENVAEGTAADTQTAGDCQLVQCDGDGATTTVADDTDLPDDSNECTVDACDSGVPSNMPVAADSPCGANGALVCDGAGQCVDCTTAAQCGTDTECQQFTCTAGVCGTTNTSQGVALTTQTPGDCMVDQCDGSGGVEMAEDNADVPVDATVCTDDLCTSGVPSNPPVAASTVCAEGTGMLCDGSGACVECIAPSDCPGTDTECQTRTCTAGTCGFDFAPNGTAIAVQTAGDCQVEVCDGAGAVTSADDDLDVPNDNEDCTSDSCVSGIPTFTDVASGTTCGSAGVCDGNGSCLGCNAPTDCPGTDTECQTRTCTNNVCGFDFAPTGTAVTTQTAGDCQVDVCDGSGNVVTQDDDADLPADDGNECTDQACSNGSPSFRDTAIDASCSQNGGSVCDGGGACVACNAASQCPGTDTECQMRTCTANTCGFTFQPNGFVIATQTPGDCQVDQCDGAGNIVPAESNGDVPVDNVECTDDVCTNGVPSNPPVAVDTACAQNGGSVCDGSGACVECNAATQCPGMDTECQVRTCTANACGVSNTAAGTPVASQTGGDCQQVECDGNGSTQSVALDTDLPVDGLDCTADVCTAGAPSNPPAAIDTACAQNGGSVCDGSGACVECNAATQCPGMDTDCQVRTCSSNACGVSNIAAGTPTGSQTTGDCQQEQCDGAGSTQSVALDTDLPVDGLECTDDVCSAGVPSNPPSAFDTACSEGGGTVCDGAGTCVECNAPTQCGTDTECQTFTCNSNVCGTNDTAAGTPTSSQTTGDCQEEQCDGSGGTQSADLNIDVPVDGFECTEDLCTAGVPSNPPLSAGTSCTEGGGTQCDGSGNCVSAPTITGTTPSDGMSAEATTDVSVSFSEAMNPVTLTGQTTGGACSGSIQVSLDDFASCIAFSSASASLDVTNTTATFSAAPGLLVNRMYKIRVTTAAQSAGGQGLASPFTQTTGFGTSSPNLCEGSVVISRVYGGGGNSGAVYTHDFIELHNRGTASVDLTGWSVQYASGTGTSWTATPLTGSIAAGGYYLVQQGAGSGGTTALPTPDVTDTTAMGGTSGKVALVDDTMALSGSCPSGVVDFVGYGSANCFEGSGATASASNTEAPTRVADACADTDGNDLDFENEVLDGTTVVPRNSATTAVGCSCVVHNESGVADEADFCNVQFPLSLSVMTGNSTGSVFGRIFEAGQTDTVSAPIGTFRAQLGYGVATANPQYDASWSWTNASFNVEAGNDDEYGASFTAPAAGTYAYVYRFSLDEGVSWTVCDTGAGSNGGLDFSFADMPVLTVTP